MQKNYITIGNVTTQNIIVNEQGDIRIVSQYSWPGLDNYTFDLDQVPKKLYSPEEQNLLKKINEILKKQQKQQNTINQNIKKKTLIQIQDKYDKNISQIFSIGMTLLQICTLKNSQDIYIKENINQNLMVDRIISLRQKYSNALIHMIWEMVRVNPVQRITGEQIYNMLSPFQQQIRANHKFTLIHHHFNNPIYINSQGQLAQIPQTQSKMQKHEKNNWSCFGNLFPFLRQIPQTQQNMIVNESMRRRRTNDQVNIQLATAR